jgi:hypothetical protein
MTMKQFLPILALTFAVFLPSASAQLSSTQKADIGFTALQSRLGINMPTGSGVSVSHVEAPVGAAYRPDTALFSNQSFTFPSGGNTTFSSHATTVGQYLYGPNSLSPDLGDNTSGNRVASYEANNWIGGGFLFTNVAFLLPAIETNDIQNHSWIGTTGNATTDTQILNRLDFTIEYDDFLAVVGLNNGSGNTQPNLLAQSYNSISVGLSNGNHSRGSTTINGAGRTKPDIVVPTGVTSNATPTVGSAAALLIEVARSNGALANAQTSVMLKSLLMAGASKESGDLDGTWSNTSARPLDSVYGAGELDIENSYHILVAGEFNASTNSLANKIGWDLGTSSTSTTQYYFFDIEATAASFTASLNWNAVTTVTDNDAGPGISYSFSAAVPNLDLRLYTANAFTVGAPVASSLSNTDNVEHIYSTSVAPGRYALAVTSDTSGINYGLSWTTAVPEPGDAVFVVVGAICVIIVARRRSRA